jgi:hypothetical protein
MKKSLELFPVFRRIIVAVLICMCFVLPSFGWDDEGHMAVAYVAYQNLNTATKTRIATLLKLNPDYKKWVAMIPTSTTKANQSMMIFMIAATWPDRIKGETNYTDDGTDDGNRPDGPQSSQNIGYSDHLRHKYWHFVDTPFSSDGTLLPAIPTPNAQTQIDAFRAVLRSTDSDALKSYDLVWILHLVGDVHQPLHASTRVSSTNPNGDSGGNDVMLCAKPCKDELHAFWDDLIGTSTSPASAETAAKKLPKANTTLSKISDTSTWIQESFEIAKKDVYVTPIGAGDGPFTMTSAYKTKAKQIAEQRIALAGVRLANLLNSELK